MILEQDKDTVTAVSTAPGTGGIAVVRISGSQALEISRMIADFVPESPESHRLYFGTLKNPVSGEALDEGLVAYFKKGHSFTGEEVIEISCHGGNFLANKIVELLIAKGARLARRGEFTYRAFMNGRLDLVQAEAVLSLIESRSESAARVALRQLKGALSAKLKEILDSVVWTAANLEANIDFAQEDIEAAPAGVLKERLEAAKSAVQTILATKDQSRLWREGFRVSLVGRPNVGKSSLLNALLREERAIVTDIPGTTRDLVEGQIDIRGIAVQMIDTAGLRVSEEVVERIGIERARSAARRSDLILFVLDLQNLQEGLAELAGWVDEHSDRILVVRNKTDLENVFSMDEWRDKLISEAGGLELNRLRGWLENLSSDRLLAVSAKTGLGLEGILDYISRELESHLVDDAPGAIHERHVELLQRTKDGLTRALELIGSAASPEFVAFELHTAVLALHEIMGQRFDDQVMDRVFGEFCLGK